jgi:hypothetical protein
MHTCLSSAGTLLFARIGVIWAGKPVVCESSAKLPMAVLRNALMALVKSSILQPESYYHFVVGTSQPDPQATHIVIASLAELHASATATSVRHDGHADRNENMG